MKVVILGAGTCAMSVADVLIQDRNFMLSGFIGNKEEEGRLKNRKIYGEIMFIGDYSILPQLRKDGVTGFIAAISNNAYREKAYYQALQAGLIPMNVISSHAVLDPSARLGKGIVINAGCIISHNVQIDNNVIVEAGSLIGINSTLSDNCFISQGGIIGGECHLGRNVFLGMRVSILPYVRIGKNQIIDAGKILKETVDDLIRETFDF